MSLNKCVELLKAAGFEPIPGRTFDESARSVCMAAEFCKDYAGALTPELAAEIRTSRWPLLTKAVSGGFQHVVSVDNAAGYAEAWAKGDSWYAVTEKGVFEVPGIKKGMDARDAIPLFLKAITAPAGPQVRKGCGGCGKRV